MASERERLLARSEAEGDQCKAMLDEFTELLFRRGGTSALDSFIKIADRIRAEGDPIMSQFANYATAGLLDSAERVGRKMLAEANAKEARNGE